MVAVEQIMIDAPKSDTTKPVPAARRWRMRWSLRVLFLLIAIIAVGMTWVRTQMQIGYVHEDAAKNLRAQGAMINWKLFERTHFPPNLWRDDKKVPAWMETLRVGPMFQRLSRVLVNDRMTPEQLDQAVDEICRLGSLQDLSSYDSQLSEAQLIRMLDCVQFESLFIQSMPLGRKELPWLRDSGLKSLVISRTQFSDPAIDDLPVSLVHLDLTRTRVTDKGLEKLPRLTNLNKLILRRTPTSETAIESLRQKMPWCEIDWQPLPDSAN